VAVPIATTTVTVLRPDELAATDDPYDDADEEPTEIATGVRANIAIADGREELAGRAGREAVSFRLRCDVADITNGDLIVDETTGEQYAVVWSRQRVTGLGLDHVVADLEQVTEGARELVGGSS
jgi:hypothetical protein